MTPLAIAAIRICRKCDMSPPSCGGACPCKQDHRDILHHAKADYCPLAKFGSGKMPAGWLPGLPIQQIPDGWDGKDYAKDSKGTDPCNC